MSTIGPWWDGNEVWLIVAGAGMFAAFPGWYATMFSALYLALLLVLVALMARGVSFEYTGKSETRAGGAAWTWALTIGSLLIPLLIGVGLGDLLHGLPINSSHNFTGNFFDLLTRYGLWTGVTLLALCLLHGATFLKLRTTDEVRERAARAGAAARLGGDRLVVGLVMWTRSVAGGPDVPEPVQVLAVIAVVFAARLASTDHDGWAFAASAVAIAATVGSIFIDLYPQRDGLEHQRRLQPDRQQLGLRPLRAGRDDDRHGDLLPGRAALPGLVLPRVPRTPSRGSPRPPRPAPARRAGGAGRLGGADDAARPRRVVIVGGGFGGLFAAKFLRRAPVEITLIDRTNHHIFQPLLYQLRRASSRRERSRPAARGAAQAQERPGRARRRHEL